MDNIFVYSDDIFARKAIVALLADIGSAPGSLKDVAIFSFGNNNISQQAMMLLLECKAERILILAKPSILQFFATLLPGVNIVFERYDTAINIIRKVILSFIQPVRKSTYGEKDKVFALKKLSASEHRITNLYIQGLPLSNIALLLNKSIKTISAHRRSAMKKMGVASNIELIQKGHLMRLLEQNTLSSFA